MTTETYTVTGMTCGHCVSSVTEEVSELPGVSDVQVDLESGRLTLTAAEPVGTDRVRAADADGRTEHDEQARGEGADGRERVHGFSSGVVAASGTDQPTSV